MYILYSGVSITRRSKNEKNCVDVRVGDSDFDFNIPTALKGWIGHAPQGRGALLIII